MSFRSHIFLLAFGLFIAEIGAIPFSLDPAYFYGLRGMAGTRGYTEIVLPISQDLNQHQTDGRRFEKKPRLKSPYLGRLRLLRKRTSKETPKEETTNIFNKFN